MKPAHRFRRTVKVMFTFAFRAAPLWMTLNLLSDLTVAIIIPLQPFTYKLFTDALLRHDRRALVVAAVLVGAAAAVQWTVRVLGATLGNRLTSRCIVYVTTRIANLVNAVPGIEHLERPDYLRELDLLRANQVQLGQAPRQTMAAAQVVIQLVGIGLLLGTVHPVLVLLPIFGFAPFLAEARAVRITERTNERLAEPTRLMNSLFTLTTTASPGKELRVFGLGPELAQRHRQLAASVTSGRRTAALKGFAVTAAGWLVFAAGFIGAGTFVLIRTLNRQASPGELLMTVGLFQVLRLQLSQVLTSITAMLTATRTAHRYLWLEDYAGTPSPTADEHGDTTAEVPTRLEHGIEFHDVCFRYPGTDTDVLRGINLFVPAGATVALVGENGAGKTTLIKLLTRMYEPTAGTILIDGTPLSAIAIGPWRRRLTAAFQDTVPYEVTAGEAIGLGDLDNITNTAALTDAITRAGALDVLTSLDQGFETPLGRSFPGGRELSGGQWQKLALARAMMRPDALLSIFDEPTASLDAHTEHRLFATYAASAERAARHNGAVTILTSHRFSTVGMADLIIVVDNGQITEQGSHDELMARQGVYAELYELQAAAYR